MSSTWRRTIGLVLALAGLAAPLSAATPEAAPAPSFSLKVLKEVAAGSPQTNVAISPVSVADVLALLGHAADGDTARQLEQVLALPVHGDPEKAANELANVSDP